jgi:hypothetical protein
MEYFFAAQLRSYRLQIIRAFSNFSVSVGTNDDGTPKLKRVPCRYGDTSRIAETIITGNSENKMPTAPFISVYVTNVELAPERRAAPSLVSTINVAERTYDGQDQRYLNSQGNKYNIQRYMPVPFTLRVNVDFWTTNLNQKEELFEQTQVLFNGMIDIQTSTNPLDWTLFSTMEPQNITWTSRSIPIGTENPLDVMTVEYKVPVWINPPALVTYSKVIEQIVTNITQGTYDSQTMEWTERQLLTRTITTPQDAGINLELVRDQVYELSLRNKNNTTQDWQNLPTVITGLETLVLEPGSAFSVNGIAITVPNTNINDLVSVMRNMFQGKNLNVAITINNRMQLINLSGGDLQLANLSGTQIEALGFIATTYPGGTMAWWRLIEQYGTLRMGTCEDDTSVISILTGSDPEPNGNQVQGTIAFHPTNQNLLYWTVVANTWPMATQSPLTAIINPQTVWPTQGLSAAVVGQRYLLSDEIALTSAAWGPIEAKPTIQAQLISVNSVDANLIVIELQNVPTLVLDRPCVLTTTQGIQQVLRVQSADQVGSQWHLKLDHACTASANSTVYLQWPVAPNDIIEFDGNQWQLAFDSYNNPQTEFVKNNFSQKWYEWTNDKWQPFLITSSYPAGFWRLAL